MHHSPSSCPRLTRASTAFGPFSKKNVDGRAAPGHDAAELLCLLHLRRACGTLSALLIVTHSLSADTLRPQVPLPQVADHHRLQQLVLFAIGGVQRNA